MKTFQTRIVPVEPDGTAPDGSAVRLLVSGRGGSMAHFTLRAGACSVAVVHRTVEELWFVVAGRGEMWRSLGGRDEVTALEPGVALSLPVGTRFQFRAAAGAELQAVAVTMPPWPGDDEAEVVSGGWSM